MTGPAGIFRRLTRRHWRAALQLRDRFRMSEETFHLVLAGAIGILGGLTQWVYHLLNQLLQILFLGGTGDLLAVAERLPAWVRIASPAVGGVLAGTVLHYGLRLAGRGGLGNLLEVVVAGDGRLRLRPALVNALSSLLSLSSGASIGREGLIIQLTATLASRLGQIASWPPYRLRLMVACGAASGLSAGCNAPIAGAVFAAQVVLGSFSMNHFAPIVFSSVISVVVSRSILDSGQWYVVPSFHFTRLAELPWFLILGVASGVVGAAFLASLRAGERMFSRMRLPLPLQLGLAGLIVGLIAQVHPEVLGNGHGATNRILGFSEGPEIFQLVLGISIAKWLATAVTVGSGTVGGVFTPTLVLGAALGSLFGAGLHLMGCAAGLPVGVFALVGMGSVLSATTHSPLLAMITAFELSLNYSLMPALMLACVLSGLVSRRFHRDSIYTEPLRRQGLEASSDTGPAGGVSLHRVGDFMRDPVAPVAETATFRQIADRFLGGANNFLPVVDKEGILVGVVALQDLKGYLHGEIQLDGIIAMDVMRPPPACLTPDTRLADALPVLLSSELRNVPVVASHQRRKLIGRVVRAEVIGAVSDALTRVPPVL